MSLNVHGQKTDQKFVVKQDIRFVFPYDPSRPYVLNIPPYFSVEHHAKKGMLHRPLVGDAKAAGDWVSLYHQLPDILLSPWQADEAVKFPARLRAEVSTLWRYLFGKPCSFIADPSGRLTLQSSNGQLMTNQGAEAQAIIAMVAELMVPESRLKPIGIYIPAINKKNFIPY